MSNKNELYFNSFLEDNENKLYKYIYNLYDNCLLLNIKYIEKIDEKYIKELFQEESIIYYLKRIEFILIF